MNFNEDFDVAIQVKGQLFSRETMRTLIRELLVPLLAKELLADESMQKTLAGIHGMRQFPQTEIQLRNRTLLTVDEAADELGIRPKTVRAWIGNRRIASVRVGRCVRVPAAEVKRVIESNTVPARNFGGRRS
jgi:excisionase family DNA binding protein